LVEIATIKTPFMKTFPRSLFFILCLNITTASFAQILVPCWNGLSGTAGKWGYSDRFYTNVVINCVYDSTFDFSEGLAKVKLQGKYGYIDRSGKLVIPASLEAAGDFHEGFTVVLVNGRYRYIDKKGTDVFKKNFKNAAFFSDGLALVSNDEGQAGFIDKKGINVIPFSYQLALPFKDGLAPVREAGSGWKVINKKGETIFSFPGNVLGPTGVFSEGMLPVTVKDDKSGLSANFLDITGKMICKETYSKVSAFHNGRAIVCTDNPNRKSGNMQFFFYGIIDKAGNVITKKKYSCLEESQVPGIYFYGNVITGISTCEGYGLLDANGREISEPKYSSFVNLSDTAFVCKEAGKSSIKSYLVITTSGRAPLEIPKLSKYFAIAGKDTLLVIYSEYGEEIFQSIYNTRTGMVKDNVSGSFYLLRKQGLILFEDYKTYGGSLITTNGTVLMDKIHTKTLRDYSRDDSPAYDDIPFLLVRKREDKGMRLYNTASRKFVEGKYDFGKEAFDYSYYYSEGMLAVNQNQKFGFIDSTARLRIPFRYIYAGTFHDGWSKVRKAKSEYEDIETWVNKAGQEMPGVTADETSDFFEGIARFTVKPKEAGYSPVKLVYITKAGKQIFTTDVAELRKHGDFSNGMAAVCNKEGKYGYINTKGDLVIPYLYKIPYEKEYTFYIAFNADGFATVSKDGKVIKIDKTGKEY
jgi:hypothetical protein